LQFWRKAAAQKLLSMLERGPLASTNLEQSVAQVPIAITLQEATSDEVVNVPEPAAADLLAADRFASSTSAKARKEVPHLTLLTAIVNPNIYIAPADRDRAIALPWMFRDIKAKRLKWSPISPDDLLTLIKFGMVEMQHDTPVLTSAGLSAAIWPSKS
jgi:hypothetical protein